MNKKNASCRDLVRTPWGWIGAVYSDEGLQGLLLPRKTRKEAEALLQAAFGATERSRPWKELREQLRSWFEGRGERLTLPLDVSPPGDFTGRVWQEAAKIPSGETVTYGEIAERAGRKGAARAAGQAMRRNPASIFIPCHRVVAAAGPGGFSGSPRPGLKTRMLALEAGAKRKRESSR
jgi:methylated-DNA-[protein]-cysteine S-methyltransferase